MSDNKKYIPQEDLTNPFFRSELENLNGDHFNNLFNQYLTKDQNFILEKNCLDQFMSNSDTSSIGDEIFRKYSDNTNDYNNFCQSFNGSTTSNKNQIFKTEKTNKKRNTDDVTEKRLLKQIRNRQAAKKCRENKKNFMNNMIEKLKQTEEELKIYKNMYEGSKKDVYTNVTNNFNLIHSIGFPVNYSNNDEYKMVKIYKDLLYQVVPHNIRDYVINFLDLSEVSSYELIIYKIDEFEKFLKKMISNNQLSDLNSLPLRLVVYLEQLSKFTKNYFEYANEVNKLESSKL